MKTLGLMLVGSAALSWLLTHQLRRWAPRIGLLDAPDARRKIHTAPVPLGGGLAVFLGALALCLLAWWFDSAVQVPFAENGRFFAGLAVAAAAIAGIGFLDDRHNLRGRQKLLAQAIACTAFVYGADLNISEVGVFGHKLQFGVLAAPITVGWLLFALNAFNLIDGVDGLAATLGAIISLALATLCFDNGNLADAAVCVALAGALFGFLWFNKPPAEIYLGDTGSMLIGFLIGALGLHSVQKTAAMVGLTTPIALLAIPFFDSLAAIVRRKLTGRSIYCTDRGHLHHCLLKKTNGSVPKTLLLASLACTATCVAALLSVWLRSEATALIGVAVVLAALIVTGMFGQTESKLVAQRLGSFSLSLMRPRGRPRDRESNYAVQGCPKECEALWRRMKNEAPAAGIRRLRLEVDAPRRHLHYVGNWESTSHGREAPSFELAMPLLLDGVPVGRVSCAADASLATPGELARSIGKWERQLAGVVRALDAPIADTLPIPVLAGKLAGAP